MRGNGNCGVQEEGVIITRKQYMAELTKLLGFMSSWDRQKVLAEYEEKFAACEDEEKLIKELGTPTKNAVSLASTYVPSPPPAAKTVIEQMPEEELQDEQLPAEEVLPGFEESFPDEEATSEETISIVPQKEKKKITFGQIAFWVLAILIGIPITVIAVCVGLPFLAAGAGIILADLFVVLKIMAGLYLLSDILLTVGGALLLCAVGLFFCWLGIWISMELCYLWVGKVLFRIGKKVTHGREAAE